MISSLALSSSADLGAVAIDAKIKGLAHREGRTRSLQIAVTMRVRIRHKSLTLYPIELGGRLGMNQIRLTRPCSALHTTAWEKTIGGPKKRPCH